MLIQVSKIKKLINSQDLRVSPSAMDGINRAVEQLVLSMCKTVVNDGMKTLMIQHTGQDKPPEVTQDDESTPVPSCKRCVNLKDLFLRWARDTQRYCHDQAVILSRKV